MLHLSQRYRHRGSSPCSKNQFTTLFIHLPYQELRTASQTTNDYSSYVAGVYLVDRVIKGGEEINVCDRIRDILREVTLEQNPVGL